MAMGRADEVTPPGSDRSAHRRAARPVP